MFQKLIKKIKNKNKEQIIYFSRNNLKISTNVLYNPLYLGQKKVCVTVFFPKNLPSVTKNRVLPMIELKIQEALKWLTMVSVFSHPDSSKIYFYGYNVKNISRKLTNVFSLFQDFSYWVSIEPDLFFRYKQGVLSPSSEELHSIVTDKKIEHYKSVSKKDISKVYVTLVFSDYFIMKDTLAESKKNGIILHKQEQKRKIFFPKFTCICKVDMILNKENIQNLEEVISTLQEKYSFIYEGWSI